MVPFLRVCTSAALLNDISSCYSYSVSLLIYIAMLFVGAKRGSTTIWKVLYVGINPGGNCSLLVAPTRSFSSVFQLVPHQDLENYY